MYEELSGYFLFLDARRERTPPIERSAFAGFHVLQEMTTKKI
jgi:hypothetical protein